MKSIKVLENSDVLYRARVVDALEVALPQSVVDAVTVSVWRDVLTSADTATPVYALAYDGTEVIESSLQSWAEDTTGYNLSLTIPRHAFRKGSNDYTVEILVHRSDDNAPVPAKFRVSVEAMQVEGYF